MTTYNTTDTTRSSVQGVDQDPNVSAADSVHRVPPSGSRKRVLLRAHRDLRVNVSPHRAAQRNLLGDNSGNSVFAHAVQRVLSTATNDITIGPLAPMSGTPDQINEGFDQYVIPLANAFRRSFAWRLDRYTDIIEKLKIPVVVVGVGAQVDDGASSTERLEPVRESVDRFMRAVLARSHSVGVRGEVTYDYLRGIGYSDDEVRIIGCPSLFQRGPDLQLRPYQGLTEDSLVSLNISPYRPKMGSIAAANTARYPNLHYVPQDVGTLRVMLYSVEPDSVLNYAPDVPRRITDELLRDGRTDFFIDPTTWAKWLGSRDVSFGSRIHGNIVSLLGGTPAYVLAHDSRTRELAEYHEIPFSPLAEVPPDVDPRDLFDKADYTGFHRNHQTRFENYVDFLNTNGIDHIFRGNPADAISVAAFDAQIEAARNKHPVTSGGRARTIARRQRLRLREAGSATLSKVRKRW